jgi:hypothetical protein
MGAKPRRYCAAPAMTLRRAFGSSTNFSPSAGINAAMREGPWKLVHPHWAQPPKSDADKRVMERYVELDIKYKYHPDEVTELMREPDPELITPPLADLELYNFNANQEEGNMIWLTVTRWS